MNGKVLWFNAVKGYGFIEAEDGQKVFAHFSQINSDGYKTLEENEEVTFDIVETDKGLQANNITKK
ncbi:CspA family cold shock protein [Bacilli bacterium PM5-3]|nr:CspA family cold shock protein [Bacilli bacterium PM5-3]MDH6603691.1 CspA family cold shock protein [Bacilli bacterium PM5-9]